MVAKVDIHNTKEVLAKTKDRYIQKLHPEDQGDVTRFLDGLLANGYSAGRVSKYIFSFMSIKRLMGIPLSKATRKDIEKFASFLESSDYSDWTKRDLKEVLRRYMRWLGKAELIDWMKIKQPKNGTLPEEVLTEEEIKAIAGAAYTARDSAFILALYESGTRIGEFLPIKLKHITFDKHGGVLMVTGKTGDRRMRIVASVLSLQQWIEGHPAKNNPDAYLWCKIPMPNNPKWKNDHLSYGFITRLLKQLAKKAGVKKKANPHAFRHARATFMARHLKEPEMRGFFGWGSDSEMPSTYVHLSGRDIDNAVLSMYGIEEARESQETIIKAQKCMKCGKENAPAVKFCKFCGFPLGKDMFVNETPNEDVDKIVDIVLQRFLDDPVIRDRAKEILS